MKCISFLQLLFLLFVFSSLICPTNSPMQKSCADQIFELKTMPCHKKKWYFSRCTTIDFNFVVHYRSSGGRNSRHNSDWWHRGAQQHIWLVPSWEGMYLPGLPLRSAAPACCWFQLEADHRSIPTSQFFRPSLGSYAGHRSGFVRNFDESSYRFSGHIAVQDQRSCTLFFVLALYITESINWNWVELSVTTDSRLELLQTQVI